MGTDPLIYLRTDANPDIALGHLMRCLTMARALQKKGAHTCFLFSDTRSQALLDRWLTPAERQENRHPSICLGSDYRRPEAELENLTKLLAHPRPACLLADSYFVTPHWLRSVKACCPVAFFDDLQAFDPPVDLVVNYDLTVDIAFYQNASKVLAGCAYTPLREQFAGQNYRFSDQVCNVFLSTGGSDPFGILNHMLSVLLSRPQWTGTSFHLIVGPHITRRTELEALAAKDARIHLHENVQDMALLMSQCDLAFCAGGTTLYELCALGVPALSYSMADNQQTGVRAFTDAGLIPTLGDIRSTKDFYERAAAKLEALAADPMSRKKQSAQMRAAIDGAGAERIALELLNIKSTR